MEGFLGKRCSGMATASLKFHTSDARSYIGNSSNADLGSMAKLKTEKADAPSVGQSNSNANILKSCLGGGIHFVLTWKRRIQTL